MTTLEDRGDTWIERLNCFPHPEHGYRPIELALRDMRAASGRNLSTGEGVGNESWIGVSMGMIVLDTLSGDTRGIVGSSFKNLLVEHGVEREDADLLYTIRNALLHGYGLPKPSDVGDRDVSFVNAPLGYALDTRVPAQVHLSVPVFCSYLVERIAAAVPEQWDISFIDVPDELIHIGYTRLPPMPDPRN